MTPFLPSIRHAIMAAIPSETQVFLYHEPPTPDACVTLYATGGPQPVARLDGTAYSPRGCQVRVRDLSAANAESRVEALFALFQSVRVDSGYLVLQASTAPFSGYPKDSNNRTIISFNLTGYI